MTGAEKCTYDLAGSEEDNTNTIDITKRVDGKLCFDHDALRTVFMRPELQGKPIAIISIVGIMRSGKSFLMNFVLRYLRMEGWRNQDWMTGKNFKISEDGFTYRKGQTKVTTGIKIFKQPFPVPVDNGDTIMVMLMDTQGLFDNETSPETNRSLVTLTTLMSSVQIFNSKDTINSRALSYLQTCVEFAFETAKRDASQLTLMKFQNLMFLVRDFVEDDPEYPCKCGLNGGTAYMNRILDSEDGGDELMKIRSGLKESFTNVDGFALLYPGNTVQQSHFKGMRDELEEDFIKLVKEFVEHIASPDKLIPKCSNDHVFTARELLNMCAACDSKFLVGKYGAVDIIKTNVETHYSTIYHEAIEQYDASMKSIPENYTAADLHKMHDDAKKICTQRFSQGGAKGSADDEKYIKEKYERHLETQCNAHFNNILYIFEETQKAIKTTSKKRLQNAFVEYKKMMQSERISNTEEIKSRHNEVFAMIQRKYQTVDLKELKKVTDKFLKEFREEAIQRRDEEQKARGDQKHEELLTLANELEIKCKHGWSECALQYCDKNIMEQKYEEMRLTIIYQYWIHALCPNHGQDLGTSEEKRSIGLDLLVNMKDQLLLSQENKRFAEIVEKTVDELLQKIKSGKKLDEMDIRGYEETFPDKCSKHYIPTYQKVVDMLDREQKDAEDLNHKNWDVLKDLTQEAVQVMMFERRIQFDEILRDRHISEKKLLEYFKKLRKYVMTTPPKDIAEILTGSRDAMEFYKKIVERAVDDIESNILKANEENRKYVNLIETVEMPGLEMVHNVVSWFWKGIKKTFSVIYLVASQNLGVNVRMESQEQEKSFAGDPVSEDHTITKSMREFFESHLNDNNIYRIDPNRSKGRVLIINNKFDGDEALERLGSDMDVKNLEILWRGMGFDVRTELNLSAAEMQASCEQFAPKEKDEVSVIVLIIMSHGGSCNEKEFICGVDKADIRTEDIISCFNAQHLTGIPKVFMFQACRGLRRVVKQTDAVPEVNTGTPPVTDMVIVYPSQKGYLSYRHPKNGSDLMNAVANIFRRNAHKEDVLSMLTMVNQEVQRIGGGEQISNQENHLNKKLYLFPGFPEQ